MPFFSIIIVNYNGRKCLEVCLPSIMRQTYTDFEVIVVDNGSTDDSLAYISATFPKIKIIQHNINSFAGANNVGMQAAAGSYFVLLNNDTELESDCLGIVREEIRRHAEHVGMWAVKILNFYNRDTLDNTGLLMYPDGIFSGRGRGEVDRGQYDRAVEILCPSGCMAVYSRKLIDEIGYLDEDFQFYLEDADLGLRAQSRGWQCVFIPGARVYHMLSASSGKYSPRKAFLVERNRLWLVIKNFPARAIIVSFYFTFIRYFFNVVSVLKKKGSAGQFVKGFSSWQLVLILFKAWFYSLLGLHSQIKKRRVIFKNQLVSRRYFMALMHRYAVHIHDLALRDF